MTDNRTRTGRKAKEESFLESTRDKAGEALGSAREKAIEAYGSARDKAGDAGRKAAETIDDAPIIALVGGLAAGAIIAALLPRTDSEEKFLGPVGDRITGSARAAVDAAKAAGKTSLDEMGLTGGKGGDTFKAIIQGAGEAALKTIRNAV